MAYLVHIIIMDHYLLTYQRTIHLTDSEYVSFDDPQLHIWNFITDQKVTMTAKTFI